MIWISFGILSIFWDGPLGVYVPLIPLFTLGTFWVPVHPLIILIILYFHHVLGSGRGVFEILSIVFLMIAVYISDIFYSRPILYFMYSTAVVLLVFSSFGMIAAIFSAIQALIVYSLR